MKDCPSRSWKHSRARVLCLRHVLPESPNSWFTGSTESSLHQTMQQASRAAWSSCWLWRPTTCTALGGTAESWSRSASIPRATPGRSLQPGRKWEPLANLEFFRLQPVAGEQLVEIRAIAAGELGRLGDVAARDLQQLHQIVAHELVAGLVESRDLRRGAGAQGTLHELGADHRAGGQ